MTSLETQVIGGRTSKRRVHEDGLVMLKEHYAQIEENQKVQQMENRLKRLQFEEERSKKMSALAQDRAEKMIKARNRHFHELVNKKNFYAQQKIEVEKKREVFN